MVKMLQQFLLVILLIVVFSGSVFAATFTARVDRSEVGLGESLTLELELSGAAPEGRPDFDNLRENFTVYSHGQSSQTSIINNKVSASISWQLVLVPKTEGTLVIPAININTDAGALRSEPVSIKVSKAASNADVNNRSVFVQAEVSKSDPYQNEPVMFTVKLVARRSIANISVPDFKIEGAIVEKQEEPRVYDGVLQGRSVKVVEVKYLVTPLTSGAVTIPSYSFKGQIETPRSASDEAFTMMEQMFPGFAGYKAFAVASQPVTLNVKPPAVAMDPWLPLTGLELDDRIDGAAAAAVGQPLTRTLTIAATGIVGTSLPDLSDKAAPQELFKVYADNPQTKENIGDDGIITGWREQRYTLIPEREGEVTLPEIKVPWWDLASRKVRYATVPARTLNVRPANDAGSATTRVYPDNRPGMQVNSGQSPQAAEQAPPQRRERNGVSSAAASLPATMLYIIIALLTAGVIVLTGMVIYLFRLLETARGVRSKEATRKVTAANQDRITAADMRQVKTPEALRGFLQTYASQHWGLPANSALPAIAAALEDQPGSVLDAQTKDMLLALDKAIYGGGTVDIITAKSLLAVLLRKAGSQPLAAARPVRRHGLNPS